MTRSATAGRDGERQLKLLQLNTDIEQCRRCPRLVEWRESVAASPRAAFKHEQYWAKPLPGFGDEAARLVLVGLAPAAHGGNRTGRMFTGDRSGDFLFSALWRAGYANQAESTGLDDGLLLSGCYVTAAVRCAPPENRPSPSEQKNCAPYLEQELALLQRREVIVVLGAFAFEAVRSLASLTVATTTARAKFSHGAEFDLEERDGRRTSLVCSYHPSQRNVFTGLLTAAMFDAVLLRAKALSSS